jgi:2-polyprenyl-6-methoxyphenol hydroxylase-like FAD-dependent oxidoreductase
MTNQNAYDVVICGAGLAGLTLALQLRQANRTIEIAVVDRLAGPLPIAAHKVGEASTEIGSFYLAEILGLGKYLDEVHYRKFGLRFFFHSSGAPFHQRPEIGLTKFIAPYAYNFDRGLLETDLRNRVTAGGIDLLEGCSIREIRIARGTGARHKIVYAGHGESNRVLEAHWVVDAMGR